MSACALWQAGAAGQAAHPLVVTGGGLRRAAEEQVSDPAKSRTPHTVICAAQAMDEPEGRAAARLKVGAAAFWPPAADFAELLLVS